MRYALKTFLLFLIIFLLFEAIGYVVALIFHFNFITSSLIFLGLAFLFNFFSYLYSDKIVLGMYRAKILRPEEAPHLYSIVEDVARRHGIPTPKVAIVDMEIPNAFATGRSPEKAVVVYTKGILRLLNERELRGVTAHELAHIRHRDVLIMTLSATMAAAISIAARYLGWSFWFGASEEEDSGALLIALIAMITLPIAAMLVHLAISRTREFDADKAGAIAIGDPISLANALRKLEAAQGRRGVEKVHPSTAHMFIVNPFKGAGGFASLFSTHPPTEERIRRLMKLAEEMGYFPPS